MIAALRNVTLHGVRRHAGAGPPTPPRSNRPRGKEWRHPRHDWTGIEAHLLQGGNAALLLINGWTDIDLDLPAAEIVRRALLAYLVNPPDASASATARAEERAQ